MWLLACATHMPPVGSSEPAEWLPAGTTSVLRSSAASNPLVLSMSALGVPCVGTLAAQLDVVYQVQRDPAEKMAVVAYGEASRDDIEACARRIGEKLDPPTAQLGLEVVHEGALTVFRAAGGREHFASFVPGRVVFADTRAQLDAFTEGPVLAPDDPIRPLLPRLEGEGMRTVSSNDYASRLTSVPSIGFVTVTQGSGPAAANHGRLLFATPDDAARFVAFVGKVAEAPGSDPIVRELAVLAAPAADGAEVDLDLMAVTQAVDARPEIGAWIQRAASGPPPVAPARPPLASGSHGLRLVYRDPGDAAIGDVLRQRLSRLSGAEGATVVAGDGVVVVDLPPRVALPGIGPQLGRAGSITLCPDAPAVREGDHVTPCPPALGVRNAELRPDLHGEDALWFQFDEVGAARLRDVTAASAAAGARMLVVLDGTVIAAPFVKDPVTAGQVLMMLGPWAGDPAVFVAALGGGVLASPLELLREEALP